VKFREKRSGEQKDGEGREKVKNSTFAKVKKKGRESIPNSKRVHYRDSRNYREGRRK